MKEKMNQRLKEIVQIYKKSLASAPDQLKGIEIMANKNPKALEAYFGLRSIVFREGALSKKDKQLIMLGINLSRRFETGIEFHMDRALEAGASEEEIVETIATAMLAGAAPAFVLGLKKLGRSL